MHINKILKFMSITLTLFSLASLSLPIYSTHITNGVACNLVIRGYNLVEFSSWGGIVVLAPLVLLGLMLSGLNNNIKTIGLLGLFILDGVALCCSTSAAYKWICEVSTTFVELHMNHLVYALLYFIAMICFYIINNACWEECHSEN